MELVIGISDRGGTRSIEAICIAGMISTVSNSDDLAKSDRAFKFFISC